MLRKIKIPILLVLALIMILIMLRLAVWQLERSEAKQIILDQVSSRSAMGSESIEKVLAEVGVDQLRYRNVRLQGQYLHEKSIFIDNKVVDGQVGYSVFTPFVLSSSNIKEADKDNVVMINRGWVSVGQSRLTLPQITTPKEVVTLNGRLNKAPAQPPLWNDKYAVNQGAVWAYLPLDEYATQMQLTVLPLVVELSPSQTSYEQASQFKVVWSDINDEWVAKHKGYAFQWFMMALAFFVACMVLVLRVMAKKNV